MSEATTIDRLSIEITSNSTDAAQGIDALATSLGKLKSNGSVGVACRNLERLSESLKKLDSLSIKKVAIQNNFNTLGTSARSAGDGVKSFGKKVNTTTLNLASMITVIQGVKAAIMPMVRLFSKAIGDAMEWDGISYQFGNAFGEQADEYARKITEITDLMMINRQTFMENSAMATSMLKGFGVGSEDAREMGLGYTELAYDIWAAFNNVYKSLDGADGAMAAVRSAIAGEVEPIRRAGFTIVESQLEITAANNGIAYSSEKATEAQKSYLRYLTLVEQATTKGIIGAYATEMGTAEGLTRTFTQQLKSLAQAFGSLFLPIMVKVMPWLQAFVTLLTEAIYKVASFFGLDIQPATWNNASNNLGGIADSADDATDSLGDTADAVGKTSKALKDLKKATIGIDELNVISPPTEKSGSGSGGADSGLDAFEGLDVESIWDKSIFDKVQFQVGEIKAKLEEALSVITAVISGFMLAIGTILVVSGANIPLGLALMAVGAVGLVATIAENWNSMSDQLAKTLTTVTAVLGGFLLAIGAFLAFSGVNVGLGAALMVAGAVSLGTAMTINWKFLEGDMKNALSILTGIVSGGLLAMGALFAFTGVDVPLGIALMVAGAVGLATAVGLNWNAMSEPLRKAIGTLEAIVGGALLTFGAILTLTGANIPLGVGMIAAGAVSLVSATALNWKSITGDLKNTIATITALVSGALIGIGAILTFTGVAAPLGIAMMAAGAVGIVATAAINWSWITAKVKGVLKELGAVIGISLLAVGALLAFTGVALPLGISLMAVGAASLVSTVALNWDSIKTAIQNAVNRITEWLKKYGLLALGVILCLTGAGIPLGVALIKQGLNTKTESGNTVGNELLNTVKQKWSELTRWWNSKPKLKAISTTVENIKTKVSEKWSAAKKWWKGTSTLEKVNVSVGLVKKGWTSVKKWVGTMPTLSAGVKLVKSGWTSVKKWLGNLDFKLNFKLPKIGVNWGSKEVLGFKISYPKSFYTYAKGGFPDIGEMFVAREAGPEMVGRIGNKTTVANNDQIVEGISEGVYAAVLAAMRQSESNGSQSVNVYLDGKKLTQSVERHQRERGASFVGRQAYGY